jgi:WD40 repeat protein
VVTVFAADECDGVPYIAMQFLQGYPLDQYLKQKGAPALAHVIRIGRETAAGLAAAHELGLVHRDIKPANLWLEAPNGRVKVLDFGLAKPIGTDAELTKSGAVVGTPAYMSPEQARGLKVDHRTDLFSLGAVLYRLCTGQNPFAGSNMMAVLMALGSEDPTPVRQLNPSVPETLAQLIHQLLAKKPEQRPPTAAEVAKRLRAVLEQLLAPARPAAGTGSTDLSAALPVVVGPLPVQPPVVAPMHITVQHNDVFAHLQDDADEPTHAESAPGEVPAPRAKKSGGKGVLIGAGVAVLLAVGVVFGVVTLMNKKRAPVVEDKSHEGDKGKPTSAVVEAWQPGPPWQPVPVGESPLDKLDPNQIPKDERFDWQPKELVAVIGSHKRRASGPVVFSPDGRYVVTGGSPPIVWDITTQTRKWELPKPASATPLGFTPDGKRLFVCDWETVYVYDMTDAGPKPAALTAEGKPAPFAKHVGGYWSLLEGGRTLVSLPHLSGKVALLDVTGAEPQKGAEIDTKWRVVANDANQIVYGAADGKVRRATIKNAKVEANEELAITLWDMARFVAVSPNGERFASREADGSVPVWDLSRTPAKVIHTFKPADTHVYGTLAFSPDGRWFADVYSHVRLYRIDGNEPKFVGMLDTAGRHGNDHVAFSADGNRAAVISDIGFVRFWDLSGPQPKELSPFDWSTAFHPPYFAPTISPVGRLMLERHDTTPARRFQLWDLTGPRPTLPLAPDVFIDGSREVVPVGDRWLESRYGKPHQFFEVADGKWRATGEPFGQGNWTLALSGKPGIVAVAGEPGAHRLEQWDLSGAKPNRAWAVDVPDLDGNGWNAFAASADGRCATVPRRAKGGNTLEILVCRPMGTKAEVYATIPLAHGGGYACALSPDGRYLVHNKLNGSSLQVEDLTGRVPKEIASFPTGDLNGYRLAFHPDGKKVAIAYNLGGGVLDIPSGKVLWRWEPHSRVALAEFAPDGRHLLLHNTSNTVYVVRLLDLTDRDRAAAEWALPIGGQVTIKDATGERELGGRRSIPPEAFEVTKLYLHRVPPGRVTDADVARLKGLSGLTELSLSNAKLTDAGLASLKNLPALSVLYLDETATTDAELEHLAGLSGLTALHLKGAKVTAAGVLRLAAALPKCRIEYDGGTIEPKK